MATRAITVHAPAGQIWPWIAQLRQGRGGFYSYDALENLIGCDIRSADRVVPEWQDVKVGDEVKLAPEVGLGVTVVEQGRALVLRGGVPMGAAARHQGPRRTGRRPSGLKPGAGTGLAKSPADFPAGFQSCYAGTRQSRPQTSTRSAAEPAGTWPGPGSAKPGAADMPFYAAQSLVSATTGMTRTVLAS